MLHQYRFDYSAASITSTVPPSDPAPARTAAAGENQICNAGWIVLQILTRSGKAVLNYLFDEFISTSDRRDETMIPSRPGKADFRYVCLGFPSTQNPERCRY